MRHVYMFVRCITAEYLYETATCAAYIINHVDHHPADLFYGKPIAVAT